LRKDIDRLMQERGLAGLVIFANDRYSPTLYYATGQHLHKAIYFRGADGRAYLIHDPMERDQAAKAGCEHAPFSQHGWNRILEEETHAPAVHGRLIAETLSTLGMQGKVAFYGEVDAGYAWQMIRRIQQLEPSIDVDASHPDVLTLARATKDPDELAAIRRASVGNVAALNRVVEFLRTLRRDGDHFRANGSGQVKLGALRRLIHQTFMEHGLAEDGESIVSQGRDAGVPHNRGNDDEMLRAGAPLLIDIFPVEGAGGYHSDMTRTYCLGAAPDPLKRAYAEVREAFDTAMEEIKLGAPCRGYQDRVCDVFEKHGHATPRTTPGTQEGYVHGLGHGVGLAVHEAPSLGGPAGNTATLEAGHVVTVEPGLYYPSRGLGVRIEDLIALREDGTYENMTAGAPYDLEIEIGA
jgi:Xaa-Pro aminopeptidase